MTDPYQILGLSKNATQDEIRTAYRNLAKKHHPDLNPENKTAETKFKEISSAYEMIGTPEARAKFDRGETEAHAQERARTAQEEPYYYSTQQGEPGGRYSHSFGEDMGAEDLFANLFGRARPGGARARGADFVGEDQLYQMEVEFKESILGAERVITLPTGKKLQVKIPPGVETGSKLRFKGQGGPGIGKGPAGDAYVEIRVNPLEGFKRVASNVEAEVPLSFIEGILGAEIKVPTLDGAVMLKVPAGVSTGSRLRIKGKGVRAKEAGDQIVVLKIVLPKKIDPELQAAIQSWNGKFSYDPRSES